MSNVYGCHGRKPYRDHHLPTGAPDTDQYRIPHAFTRDCQYTKTQLGQADPKCAGCKHREAHQGPATLSQPQEHPQ